MLIPCSSYSGASGVWIIRTALLPIALSPVPTNGPITPLADSSRPVETTSAPRLAAQRSSATQPQVDEYWGNLPPPHARLAQRCHVPRPLRPPVLPDSVLAVFATRGDGVKGAHGPSQPSLSSRFLLSLPASNQLYTEVL